MRSCSRVESVSIPLILSSASSDLRTAFRSDTSSFTNLSESAASNCCSGGPSCSARNSSLDVRAPARSLASNSRSWSSWFSESRRSALDLNPASAAFSSSSLLSRLTVDAYLSFSCRCSSRSFVSSSFGTDRPSCCWDSCSLLSAAHRVRSSLPMRCLSLCSCRAMSTTSASYRFRKSCSSSRLICTTRSATSCSACSTITRRSASSLSRRSSSGVLSGLFISSRSPNARVAFANSTFRCSFSSVHALFTFFSSESSPPTLLVCSL
mmetsp:Transcript_11310/g.27164  ORF Transcript_11310/g.27164 Transcript_11310/m.27164 type:complete len:266 (-) Transcript_11310:22-819(-)